jgi:hypothetical protein
VNPEDRRGALDAVRMATLVSRFVLVGRETGDEPWVP